MSWIVLGMFFVTYEIFLTPYRLCFQAPAKGVFFFIECVINLYFIMDVILNFFIISNRNEEGKLILDHGRIIKKYLSGWFLVDFPASVPFDWFVLLMVSPEEEEQLPSNNRVLRMVRVLRLLKMARILRVGKIGVFMQAFEQELLGSSWRVAGVAISKILRSF